MSFILDASIALAWCSKREHTPALLRLLKEAETAVLHVPAIWPIEVSNVLALMHRKGRLNDLELDQGLCLLASLEIKVHPARQISEIPAIVAQCQRNKLTAYDSEYMHLALALRLPIATLDMELRASASEIVVLP